MGGQNMGNFVGAAKGTRCSFFLFTNYGFKGGNMLK